MKKLNLFLTIILGIFFLISSVGVALAAPKTANLKTVTSKFKAKIIAKLKDKKLEICKTKEKNIQNRSTSLNKLVNTMLTNFDKIATKVEKYYTDKVIPSGKTVSNYDALVADIATKKQTVQEDLAKVAPAAELFDCTSDNPKEQLTNFRTAMQTVKKDLKDYRTSIKNLIVAIRSVTGTTESATPDTTKQGGTNE